MIIIIVRVQVTYLRTDYMWDQLLFCVYLGFTPPLDRVASSYEGGWGEKDDPHFENPFHFWSFWECIEIKKSFSIWGDLYGGLVGVFDYGSVFFFDRFYVISTGCLRNKLMLKLI